jgi:hypothetical protein
MTIDDKLNSELETICMALMVAGAIEANNTEDGKLTIDIMQSSRGFKKAKAALRQLIREADQEHYKLTFSDGGGTTCQCECGKIFSTDSELKGHIAWHIARLRELEGDK